MFTEHGINDFFDQVDEMPAECHARDRGDGLTGWLVENFGHDVADAVVERVSAGVL